MLKKNYIYVYTRNVNKRSNKINTQLVKFGKKLKILRFLKIHKRNKTLYIMILHKKGTEHMLYRGFCDWQS